MGIEHALLPEQGLVTAGDVVIGADRNMYLYGCAGCLFHGGAQPIWCVGMATGEPKV